MDHSFNPIFAQRYGMVAAVLMHDFAYWIAKNRANGKHMHDGLCWTYNSAGAFHDQYPYMSRSQIYGALKKMLNDGLIVKGDYNTDKWIHTPWYAITEKGYSVIMECAVKSEERRNGREFENETVECVESEQSSFENCDDDVSNLERGRDENATTYIYNYITDKDHTDTEEHLRDICKSEEDDEERVREDSNPFGNGDFQRPVIPTAQKYALDNLRAMTPGNMQEFNEFMTAHGVSEDVMRYAIDVACGNGSPIWNYVSRVLYSWLDAGVKTVGDAKAQRENHRKKRDGPNANPFGIDRTNNKIPIPMGRGKVV